LKTLYLKKTLLIICLAFLSSQLQAQVINYDKDGNKLKSVNEYIDISVINTVPNKTPAVSTSIAGVILGPVYNIVSSLIKNSLEKKQKSFTASYSNSSEFSASDFKNPGMKSLLITRYAINSLGDTDENHLMAQYILTLLPDENCLSIELKSVFLKRSKARYKKKDNLSIAINIKATSIKQTISQKEDAKSEMTSKDSEGTITIPIIIMTGENQDFNNSSNIINKIKLNGIIFSSSIKFAITITETNISHIDPSKVQTIISNSTGDIQSILKAIFGVPEK
jgi:hypothetical protein